MRRPGSELRESLTMALQAIAAHKLRSGLTLLGVLVGVFSIILVMTAMRALKNNIEHELGSLGGTTFVIQRRPGSQFAGPGGFMKIWRRARILLDQANAFKKRATFAPVVGFQSANSSGEEIISRFTKSAPNIPIEGATPGTWQTNNWTLLEGRPMLESDVDSARDVCFLSKGLAASLFPHSSAIGERVKLGSAPRMVAGVFERASSPGSSSESAVLPMTNWLNRYGRRQELSIAVQASSPATFAETVEQARGAFRALRKVPPGEDDDFEIVSSDAMIAQFEKVTFAVRAGLTVVSSIALLAAGVGIMNIMLVSVTERTREIGLRRAIGARRRSIMVQFIMEAVVLSEIGGFLGIAAGLGGANALAVYLLKVPPAFPIDWAFLALLICSLVGVVFGTYPAYKAAHLDPIESLRHE